jgi:hypothetical protein
MIDRNTRGSRFAGHPQRRDLGEAALVLRMSATDITMPCGEPDLLDVLRNYRRSPRTRSPANQRDELRGGGKLLIGAAISAHDPWYARVEPLKGGSN